jgi:predicted lysophospholipase L1 biosynthesis ABC-type transport system permease subunit
VDAVYVPALQDPAVNDKCLVVRGAGSTSEEVKQRVESLGQELVGNVQTLDHIANAALLEQRISAGLASYCGAFALMLAAVGLYGLMSYTVSERRREIGIRMALGAEPRRVVVDVVRSGLVVTLAGTAAGLLGALAASRLLESLLFGVTVRDPFTLVGAPACLAAVALAACLVPALRAARVDPMIALRAE